MKFERCKDDEFPNGCNDIPNCIEAVGELSSSTPSTDSVFKTQVSDTANISSLCARSSCDKGYTKQDDKCVSDSVIEQQKKEKEKEEAILKVKKENCENTFGEWDGSTCTCTVPDTELRGDKCVCKSDAYELIIKNRRCELKSEFKPKKEACESTLGKWNDTTCTCTVKDTKLEGDKCVCIHKAYELNPDNKRCELKPELKPSKDLCEKSHGTWDKDHCVCDESKLLILNSEGTECECNGDDYVYNQEQQKCVLTERAAKRNACNAALNTEWIESERLCKCTESGKEWNGTMCVYSKDYLKCSGVNGAEWNKKENKCVCTSGDQELKDWQCVDTKATIAKRVIDTSFPRFEALITGLEVNKWKSADGTFNVARLASDSIAGAVLGTASGLITGSIIKKNQVKKGFENVRCVVGNQVVAGYGDEFTVDAQ